MKISRFKCKMIYILENNLHTIETLILKLLDTYKATA